MNVIVLHSSDSTNWCTLFIQRSQSTEVNWNLNLSLNVNLSLNLNLNVNFSLNLDLNFELLLHGRCWTVTTIVGSEMFMLMLFLFNTSSFIIYNLE